MGVGALLVALVGVPLASPLAALSPGHLVTLSPCHLQALARNTFLLVGGALALALPAGVLAAFLVERTDLPGRRLFRALAILALFVPLPLCTSAWQSVVGSGGLLPMPVWNVRPAAAASPLFGAWSPWGQGLASAVWIHAVAAFPWVVLLVGYGLRGVERGLEEDALTRGPAWRVARQVTLVRASAAIGAAALWVALQAAGEITVTDVMQVRTFAEEVYAHLSGLEAGDRGLARAVAGSLAGVAVTACILAALAWRWERRVPAGLSAPAPPLVFRLGALRWPLAVLLGLTFVLLLGVPLAGLIYRAGLLGAPAEWSLAALGRQLRKTTSPAAGLLASSLGVAVAAGIACAALGLLACWCAREAPRFRAGLFLLCAVAWAMPGPVLGLGFKGLLSGLLWLTGEPAWLATALWHGPSFLPVFWVDVVRFTPCAVALLWPAVRLVRRDLIELVRLDSGSPLAELRHAIWPVTAGAALRAVLAVAVLSLGELGAGKLVATPGADTYAQDLFTQMHYGVSADLAARALLLLAPVAFLALAAGAWRAGSQGE